MTAIRATTVLIAAIAAHGCGGMSYAVPLGEGSRPGARQVTSALKDGRARAGEIVPLDESGRGTTWIVPTIFEDGYATHAEVAEWTSVIRRGEALIPKDLNADGQQDLLLAEAVGSRGSTGNRSFLVFVAGSDGYGYAGGIGNFSRGFGFPSGNCYVLDYGFNGPEMHVGLHAVSRGLLVSVGGVILGTRDPGDVRLRDRLRQGEWSEAELRALFTAVRANPGMERASER